MSRRRALPALALLAALAGGCRRHEPAYRGGEGSATGSAAATGSATATGGAAATATATATDPCAKAHPDGGAIPWFEDDLAAAQACAARRRVPLVLDLWAPWCHTCLSMKTTVFTDPSLAAEAGRFVFASLDTDRETSAAAVARYPVSSWPTYYVLGEDGAVLSRFVGGANLAQFRAFLEAGAAAAKGGNATAPVTRADHLLAAQRATAAKDTAAAVRELRAALAAAPTGWPPRANALVSLIQSLYKQNDHAACLALAEETLAATPSPLGQVSSTSDFLYYAVTCAAARAKDEAPRAKALRERAVAAWTALTDDPAAALSVDDRSDALANLRSTLDDLGRKDEAHAVAERQRALLDETAAKAPNPTAASTYNWPRAEVYAYLARPLDLVPALEKSVTDLPTEYDPRARLAYVLWKGGKLVEAARRADEAAGMAYGPRKAKILALRADIAKAAADTEAEHTARAAAVATLEALPAGQASPEQIAAAKDALAAIGQPQGSAGLAAPAAH